MTKPAMQIGEISKPRFEFRTFGQDFDIPAKYMARLSVPIPEKVWERTSEEIYILSKTIKIIVTTYYRLPCFAIQIT